MPTRLLREGIIDSEAVNSLSLGAEVFYRRLMSVADDHGLYSANPMLLLGKVFALRMDSVGVEEVTTWLGECEEAGLIRSYQVSGKAYLQIRNFGQKARSAAKHPMPPEDPQEGGQGPAHEGRMSAGDHNTGTADSECGRPTASANNCSQNADNREQMRALCVCGDVCECEGINERESIVGSGGLDEQRTDSQSDHNPPEPVPFPAPAAAPPADPTPASGSTDPPEAAPDPTPYRDIVREFNRVVAARQVTWPAVKKKTAARTAAMRARWRTDAKQDLAAFTALFERAADSDFLSGRSGRWTACNFDWFLKPANWAKVVEGTYDKPKQTQGTK